MRKSFGPKTVLDGLLQRVRGGDPLHPGKSGTGKSVIPTPVGFLIPTAAGFSSTRREFTGAGEKARDEIRAKYGILFQGAALFDSMDIYDNVAFGLRRKKISEEEIAGIVPEMLERVGLRGVERKKPSELSGGMQKRAGLARAIAMRPEIMLYDEPTTGVDPITAGAVDRLILKMRADFGITSVVVTHDINSAYRVADRIVMLLDGKVLMEGSPDLFRNTDEPRVRQFVEGRAAGPVTIA